MSNVKLPDLPGGRAVIVAENIRATGPIYFSAMLEELKLYQVVDQLVEAFQSGMVPVKKNSARSLYQYWREGPQRLTESDRKNLYTRVLGIPGGDDGVVPNRDFNDLWIRFVASVSELARQNQTDPDRQATVTEQTRVAGRELALNLSHCGYGVALFAATELQKQINQIVKLLSDPEIQRVYGARDLWQVVERVANLELGGAANSVRYRTLATTGANIIAWLAQNTRKFSISTRGQFLNLKTTLRSGNDSSPFRVSKSPTDVVLVNACEQWLAVSSTSDESIDSFSHSNR